MLNRLSKTHGKLFVGLGQFCLVLGILLTRLTRDGEVALFGFPLSGFWQGALAGLGTVLLGVSIPFNLMAIRRWRDRRNRTSQVAKVDR